ncbi:helix-turn-helix transcriptional regulator [Pseudoclavibacter endophyticus]|nr:helix-turn-helix domain-containing protein [Pseudoclavibacter endophyticus]
MTKKTVTVPVIPDREPLMNEHEVAARLGVRVGLLREWRYLDSKGSRSRGPKYLKLGRLVRYRQSEIDRYIDECSRI